MNISQLLQTIPYLKDANLVANVIGKHGIGKSSVIKQFAKDNGYGFYPFFLSQMSDVADLLGLPEFDRDKNGKAISTSFIHPAKLPKQERSILFFDELNRASKDLLQAIFQLALEGTCHDYILPKDSIIIMAMNPATDDYSVLDFGDKAFGDRFVHINLDPSHEEFHTFMRSKYGTSDISTFLQTQTKLLEELDLAPVTLDFVKPSRRSWDRLQALQNTGIPTNLFRECGMGIVGATAMIAYGSWQESQAKVLDGKDILNNYSKVKKTFKGYFLDSKGKELETPRTDIVAQVASSTAEELKAALKDNTITDKQLDNLLEFLLDAPVENMYATLTGLKVVPEFATNAKAVEKLHKCQPLIDKCLEAKKASDSYKESQKK
jgi:hypothetical protein